MRTKKVLKVYHAHCFLYYGNFQACVMLRKSPPLQSNENIPLLSKFVFLFMLQNYLHLERLGG